MKKLLLFGIVWCFSVVVIEAQSPDQNTTDQKFAVLLGLIDQNYMDSTDLSKLTETAIRALLKELDPHSMYIPQKDVEKMNEQLIGSFEGIGITFQIFHDSILVISATPGGPAEKAGIQAGDRIVVIAGEESTGKKVDEAFVFKRLRGQKGTEVVMKICRPGVKELLEYTVKRDVIPLFTVVASYMLDTVTGYIRLSRFSSQSAREVKEALVQLKEQGMENVILDLRGNSGGYMNVAINIADEFLPEEKMIVYTKGLRSPVQEFHSKGKGRFEQGRLVLLIDEGSASASEIVAGAVQDWDRALLIGRRSYGKGLVQKPYTLPDGSQVRLTTARYYTPSGRCIQRPYDEGTEKYFKEFSRRVKHGELVNSDSIRFPDSLKYTTPAGRIVYGGGGIMPDIFLAFDSTGITTYYTELVRKGILTEFCLQYVEGQRKSLKRQYDNEIDFTKTFVTDDKMVDELCQFAEEKDLKRNEEQILASGNLLKTQIKGLVGRDLYGTQAFHRILGESDPAIQKAREVIRTGIEFRRLSME